MAMTAPRPLGYWVKALDRLIDEQFEQAAEATGLTPGEWRVLNRLSVGAEQTETVEESLAPLTDSGRPVADTLSALVTEGLVEKQAQEHRLTNDGYVRADQVEAAAMEQVRAQLGAELEQQEYDDLLATLERLAKALGWSPV
jgi:DNA-binding MarR family transcriptional regulator